MRLNNPQEEIDKRRRNVLFKLGRGNVSLTKRLKVATECLRDLEIQAVLRCDRIEVGIIREAFAEIEEIKDLQIVQEIGR